MKVVLTIHSADLYGAGRSLLDHALALRGGEFDFTILLPSHGPLVEALKKSGFPVLVSPSANKHTYYRFALEQFQRLGQPLCHVHSTFPLIAALAARRAGCPILWHVREERQRSFERRPDRVRRWGSQLLAEVRRMAIGGLSGRIVYVSEASHRQFNFPQIPSDVLFNFLPEMPNPTPRRPDGEPLALLYVGRVCLEKGADEFVGICRGLLDRGLPFRAVMAGSIHPDYAGFPDRLSAMGLDNHVSLAGYQPELDSMYQGIDVLLFPSHTEGFGRPVMEAMARGVIVVASRVGGIPEMIEPGQNGFLFDPAKPSQAVDMLMRLAADSVFRRDIGDKARESAARLFSRDIYVEKMTKIYTAMSAGF